MQHQLKIARYLLCFSLLVNLLLHIPFVNLGPRSVHAWRQCNTLAVARNFYLEDMNILQPRVDRRLDGNGVTGMQFPSYEYGLALSYKAFGENNSNHRLWSLLISSLGALGMFFLAKLLLKNPIAAAIAASAYLFSPDLFYFGFSALPDILALACSVWGLYLFLRWHEENNTSLLLLSLFFVVLAGLTKLQFLAIGFFIAPLVLLDKRNVNRILHLSIFGITCIIIPLAWYYYSVKLIETSGLYDFGITFRPESDWNKGIATIFKNLSSDLPDLLLNYASFLLFIYAVFLFFKNRFYKNRLFIPMLSWTIALFAYHIIELAQMDVHSYYMMPYLPVLILMVAYASRELLQSKKAKYWAFGILLLHPTLAATRIIPSRFTKADPGIPIELYQDASRKLLQNSVPSDALCLVGPDPSGCIYFYHLQKKGFGFNSSEDLFYNNDSSLKASVRRGAQYLISNDTNLMKDMRLKPYLQDSVTRVGSFFVYSLH